MALNTVVGKVEFPAVAAGMGVNIFSVIVICDLALSMSLFEPVDILWFTQHSPFWNLTLKTVKIWIFNWFDWFENPFVWHILFHQSL